MFRAEIHSLHVQMTARSIFVVILDIKILVKGWQMRLQRISSVNAGCPAAYLVAHAMKELFEFKPSAKSFSVGFLLVLI